MKQCEIWLADLNPVRGSGQMGIRPVVIISGNVVNECLPVVIVCPLSTRIKEYKGNLVIGPDETNGLTDRSEVYIFQVRSLSKGRLTKRLGWITKQQLSDLKQGLNDILRY
jgi:mRNA interferase MazF